MKIVSSIKTGFLKNIFIKGFKARSSSASQTSNLPQILT